MALSIGCLYGNGYERKRQEQSIRRRRGAMATSTYAGDALLEGIFPQLTTRTGIRCLKGEATLDETYRLEKLVGKGGFSEVWLASYKKRRKEDPVAIKLMTKWNCHRTVVANEISVLKVLHGCTFTVQMLNNFQTPTHYAIVMKYATRGTLHERVKMVRCFSELVARFYAAEIAEGIFGLHHRGIIHRDLTLDNVLICENGHIVLSDFGLSLLDEPEEIDTPKEPWVEAIGKLQFPAPEFFLGLQYDKTVDWWALGIMLYRMVCGEFPFSRPRKRGIINRVYEFDLVYRSELYPSFLSPQIKTLLCGLLCRRRTDRLGYGQLEEIDVSNMAFFHNVDWCQLRDHVLPAPFSELLQPVQQRKRSLAPLPTSYTGSDMPKPQVLNVSELDSEHIVVPTVLSGSDRSSRGDRGGIFARFIGKRPTLPRRSQ